MTNSEEIFEIVYNKLVKALNENDKLKAEIEQDKRRLEDQRSNLIELRKAYDSAIVEIKQLSNVNGCLVRINDNQNKEIEQLSEKLGESLEESTELSLKQFELEDTIKKLNKEIEQLKSEFEQSVKFKEYFIELYNQGLEIANWHLNGDLEPLTNFIDSACEEAEKSLRGGE